MDSKSSQEIRSIAQEMRERINWYREMGVDNWKIENPASGASDEGEAPSGLAGGGGDASPHKSGAGGRGPEKDKTEIIDDGPKMQQNLSVENGTSAPAMNLEEIRAEIGDCRRCKLCNGRKNIVFGEGNSRAPLMFVGEAPGEDEDRQARPFVGRAGQLLTKMITAMGLSREEVYIANIIKCRPPQNRNPQPDEIAACQPFLLKQIQAIRPKIICALGTFSAQTLLSTQRKISEMRGRFHDFQGTRVLPTFHPAYLLRNPNEKKRVWEDLQKIMEALKEGGRISR